MLVSDQTKMIGGSDRVMRDLISSCYEARESFRSAAAVSEDWTVKRLLEIYAQQRTRFAEELREHLEADEGSSQRDEADTCWYPDRSDSLRTCLDRDARTLELYRQALAARELSTRMHFLIASQLALLERAHERVSSLVNTNKGDAVPRPGTAELARA